SLMTRHAENETCGWSDSSCASAAVAVSESSNANALIFFMFSLLLVAAAPASRRGGHRQARALAARRFRFERVIQVRRSESKSARLFLWPSEEALRNDLRPTPTVPPIARCSVHRVA